MIGFTAMGTSRDGDKVIEEESHGDRSIYCTFITDAVWKMEISG